MHFSKYVNPCIDSSFCRGGISRNIGSLGISNFSSHSMLDPQKVVPFTISSEDQALLDILAVPDSQQTILITLDRAVLSNDPTDRMSNKNIHFFIYIHLTL